MIGAFLGFCILLISVGALLIVSIACFIASFFIESDKVYEKFDNSLIKLIKITKPAILLAVGLTILSVILMHLQI